MDDDLRTLWEGSWTSVMDIPKEDLKRDREINDVFKRAQLSATVEDGTVKFREWAKENLMTPDDFLMNRHKKPKCVRMHPETFRQIERQDSSGQWEGSDGTIGGIAGIPIVTDAYMDPGVALVIPEAPLGEIKTLTWHPIPIESSEPVEPVPAVSPLHIVRKMTFFITLQEDEDYAIAHEMSFDCIVQVTSVMTGEPVEGLRVTKLARGMVLNWKLNDASPVEDPTINVCVVVIG